MAENSQQGKRTSSDPAIRVSVVIPVYKAEEFVEHAVESALSQPEAAEILLVEDGSPDGSLEVCERLAATHDRVHLHRHPEGQNLGAGETRNLGILRSQSEFVSFLDADDYYLPGRFAYAAKKLLEDSTIDGVYEPVGTDFTDEEMRQWWLETRARTITMVRQDVSPDELFETLTKPRYGAFHTNGIVVRREVFERSGLFDPSLKMCQDFGLWLKFAAVARLVHGDLEQPVAVRRVHGNNRIFRNADQHNYWTHRMYESLALWAKGAGISRIKRRLLLSQVVSSWLYLTPDDRRRTAGTTSSLAFLTKLSLRHPLALGDRRYWRTLIGECGGPRMLKFVQKFTGRSQVETTTSHDHAAVGQR